MSYKLTEADVEFWAERYGAYSKATEDALKLAMDEFIKAIAWSREVPEDQWKAEVPAVCRNTVSIILNAGAIAHQGMAVTAQIEQTIKGRRGSKSREADLERVKQRAPVLQVLKDTSKSDDNK
jgi:hypothetical protein